MDDLYKLILTPEEAEKRTGKDLYILRLEKGYKRLLYFGASHQFTLEHPQFEQIKKEFNNFHPQLVLWEGSVNIDLSSEENAIRQGEAVYAIWLAKHAGIESKTLDVPFKVGANYQAENFGRDASFAFFTMRQLNTLYRRMEDGHLVNEDTVEYDLNTRINQLNDLLKWNDFDFSMEHLKEIFKKLTDPSHKTN